MRDRWFWGPPVLRGLHDHYSCDTDDVRDAMGQTVAELNVVLFLCSLGWRPVPDPDRAAAFALLRDFREFDQRTTIEEYTDGDEAWDFLDSFAAVVERLLHPRQEVTR